MNSRLKLAVGLALLFLIGTASGAEIPGREGTEPLSRFVRTANALAIATEEQRTDFASIALAEMAISYLAEADLARHQSRQLERGNKLDSWSAGVYEFVDQLVLFQEDIDFGFPVEFRHLHGQVIALASGGRTVILSHPRHLQQAAYEQRVLADFCGRHDCERLTKTALDEVQDPIPVTAAIAQPEWKFLEAGAECSHQGIDVRFTSADKLAVRRDICQQLMQEAESLAAELAWQLRHGVPIDWEKLSIGSMPERPEHIIRLNRSGDSILAPLPLLYSTKGLLPRLIPWLQSRYDGDDEPFTVDLDADSLGWE